MEIVRTIVEIPQGSQNKYEYGNKIGSSTERCMVLCQPRFPCRPAGRIGPVTYCFRWHRDRSGNSLRWLKNWPPWGSPPLPPGGTGLGQLAAMREAAQLVSGIIMGGLWTAGNLQVEFGVETGIA